MHEHDGSGCYDCACSASPMNTWPCTCPSSDRMKNRTTLVGNNPIKQTVLTHPRFEGNRFGEMTLTRNGRHVMMEIEIDKDWEELADMLNFDIVVWPNPAVRATQFKKPKPEPAVLGLDEESHIIRGTD